MRLARRHLALVLVAAALLCSGSVFAAPASFDAASMPLDMVEHRIMPKVDSMMLAAQAAQMEQGKTGVPYRFAEPLAMEIGTSDSGTWETLADGSRLWRLRITSPGALHQNLGFSRFDLPRGARMWLYDPAGDLVQGPYDASDRSRDGGLFTAIVPGETIVLELHVPAGAQGPLDVRVERLNQGFRGFQPVEKNHGACNIDVICPEGDGWRDQIRSVARYTIDGTFQCSGQLVNNTSQDDTPYFLSAFHCDVSPANDDTLVFYWNYEAPSCGQQSGGSLTQNQSGSTFVAGEAVGDFVLVRLDEAPDPEFDVFYSGWDVTGQTPSGSVGIHHASGHVKSISFNTDPLSSIGWDPDDLVLVPSGVDHWMVDNWEDGTTEGGSSGSCIWDPVNGLCVGVLTAGVASCSNIDFDIYGKLWYAWESAGNTPAERLRDWLDPGDSGATTLQGKDPGDVEPPTCVPTDTTLCLNDDRFRVEVEWADFDGNDGPGEVVPAQSDDSGLFYFFNADNWEMLVKVLDGCTSNSHFWVFAAATTNVEYTLKVTDTVEGSSKSYFNPLGNAASAITDTSAFSAPCGSGSTTPRQPEAIRLDAPPPPGVYVTPLGEDALASLKAGRAAGAARSESALPEIKATGLTQDAKRLDGLRPKACVDQSIECGQTVQSTLDTSDCPLDDGTFVDFFLFDGEAGQDIEINLMSNDFDTFLFLLDPTPEVVEVDDDGGSGTNSRLLYALDSSGEWAIAVNNFAEVPGDPGDYTLSLACESVTPEAPAAPSNLTANAISSTEIEIRWRDNSNNEDDFEVQARVAGGQFESIGTVPANTVGATVTGLEPETTYEFRIRAGNETGSSSFSNTASATTSAVPGDCVATDTTICLLDGRFQVKGTWGDFDGNTGDAMVVPFGSSDSGLYWFFGPSNWEMLVKMVDGCTFNEHFWVFAAAVTNVEYTLTVTDTQTGNVQTYFNPLGVASPAVTDTTAFATCP